MKNKEKEIDFKKAYKEIEEINNWFELEDIDLEEAIIKYDRGMELIGQCKKRLEKSKNKFEEIKEKYKE